MSKPMGKPWMTVISQFVAQRAWVVLGFIRRLAGIRPIPLPIQLDITNACNLTCKHCYHPDHKNRGAIALEDWRQIILEYKELVKELNADPYVLFCGGEPFLSPYLDSLVSFVRHEMPAARIVILTNGTTIFPKNIEVVKAMRSVQFQISLDGPNEKMHDAVRGKGSFAKAKEAISYLKAAGQRVTILTVLSKRTSDFIEDFFSLAKELAVDGMNFTRLISQGAGEILVASGNDRPLRPLELKRAFQQMIIASAKYGVATDTKQPLMRLLHPSLGAYGHFGECLVVDYKGNLKITSRSNDRVGNVLQQGLRSLYFNDPTLKALRAGRIHGCKSCEYVLACGGDRNAAYADTGDFLGPDPGCWKSLSG